MFWLYAIIYIYRFMATPWLPWSFNNGPNELRTPRHCTCCWRVIERGSTTRWISSGYLKKRHNYIYKNLPRGNSENIGKFWCLLIWFSKSIILLYDLFSKVFKKIIPLRTSIISQTLRSHPSFWSTCLALIDCCFSAGCRKYPVYESSRAIGINSLNERHFVTH